MPKILIKEFDRTSAGTPGSYANYSVLIPGYMSRIPVLTADAEADETGATVADKIQPDSNGVYEFNSKQDFIDTIGFNDKELEEDVASVENADGEVHYGKRMAYALLNLGYPIIYAPIKSVLDENGIATETFWEIFKDKANYDFRFISHGLLETKYDKESYAKIEKRVPQVEADIKKLAEILAAYEDEDARDTAYNELINPKNSLGGEEYDGFWDYDNMIHYSYINALLNYTAEEGKEPQALIKAREAIAAEDRNKVTPGTINAVNSHIAKLASYRVDEKTGEPFCNGRGDCTALIELSEDCYANTGSRNPEKLIIDGIEKMTSSIGEEGAYCAMTVPSVCYKMSMGVEKFPGAFHYLACFMSSLASGFAEWYAAAGYTRGVSSYAIDHTTVKLGEIAINALEPRNKTAEGPTFACNVIANFRGSYYLWGNRTAARLNDANSADGDLTAKHFLNIRQLCTTIKKQLYVACRRFTFDPNSDTLWFNFVNAITPTLDAMKADQGIRDYKILKVFTDKKATMKAKIRIIPIEAVEDFDLEISLEDSFGETSAVING